MSVLSLKSSRKKMAGDSPSCLFENPGPQQEVNGCAVQPLTVEYKHEMKCMTLI